MNILFLCTSNINRSKTTEVYFSNKDKKNTYKSAGLSTEMCQKSGTLLCSEEMLVWADRIFVMEEKHLERIKVYTSNKYIHKISNLGIDGIYTFMDTALIEVLEEKLRFQISINL